MIYLRIDTQELIDHKGKLAYIEPQVHIEADVTANVDVARLRGLKDRIQQLLHDGLNEAIIKEG